MGKILRQKSVRRNKREHTENRNAIKDGEGGRLGGGGGGGLEGGVDFEVIRGNVVVKNTILVQLATPNTMLCRICGKNKNNN